MARRNRIGLVLRRCFLGILALAGTGIFSPFVRAGETDRFWKNLSPEWGGHLRGQLLLSRPPEDSVYQTAGGGTYADGVGEFRLKNRLFFGDWGTLETHYEATAFRGETREKNRALRALFGSDGGEGASPMFSGNGGVIDDDRRFLDLSRTLGHGDDWIVSHRIDRLALSVRTERDLSVRIGRQALTWGNGLLFNPLDLFNPFAPTDVIRDYKVGDDMVFARSPAGSLGEFQAVYVPRRNPADGEVAWEESALGARFHFARGTLEFDLLGGWNHENGVVGAGASGYLGGAAWRADLSYTRLPEESENSGYFSAVANLDYSWVAWDRNWYGFLEFFHNGMGNDDYAEALADPDLSDALARGERFTLGPNYLAGQLQLEIHPLVNLFLTSINNLADPSGVLQPRVVWSATQSVEILAGASLYWGGAESEYGGFAAPGLPGKIVPAPGAYGWVTWYF